MNRENAPTSRLTRRKDRAFGWMAEINPVTSSRIVQWSLPLNAQNRAVRASSVFTIHRIVVWQDTTLIWRESQMSLDCSLLTVCPELRLKGGTEPILGTNPIAVGIPSNTVPLLFDMSTAAITNGDLLVAMQEGTPIAEGIAFDPEGEPTTDADAALKGSVRPFGGHKGFGLALITQILAGALVNAATIPPPGKNYGLLIVAIDPTSFVPLTQFKTEVDTLIARVKENRREAGVAEILIPGERAYRQREIHLAQGIHLEDALVTQLTC